MAYGVAAEEYNGAVLPGARAELACPRRAGLPVRKS
jgi:hypothetical protein